MIKATKQFVIDGSFWACIYFGMYLGVDEVKSALIFALWVVSALLWLFLIVPLSDELKESMLEAEKPSPWHSAYGVGSTWIEAMTLAAFGYYAIASVYLLGSLMARSKVHGVFKGAGR